MGAGVRIAVGLWGRRRGMGRQFPGVGGRLAAERALLRRASGLLCAEPGLQCAEPGLQCAEPGLQCTERGLQCTERVEHTYRTSHIALRPKHADNEADPAIVPPQHPLRLADSAPPPPHFHSATGEGATSSLRHIVTQSLFPIFSNNSLNPHLPHDDHRQDNRNATYASPHFPPPHFPRPISPPHFPPAPVHAPAHLRLRSLGVATKPARRGVGSRIEQAMPARTLR